MCFVTVKEILVQRSNPSLGPGGRGGGAEHEGVLCGEWGDSVTMGVTRQPGNPVIYQWTLVRD